MKTISKNNRSNTNMLIEVIIPVFNEEKTIETQVLKVISFLESINTGGHEFSLNIADNGSDDMTPKIVSRLIRRYPRILKYTHVDKKGVGLALKTAWGFSKSDIIGYMDLDLATDLEYLPLAIDKITNDNFDIVYGSRLHKTSTVIGRSLKREISSRVFNLILKRYLGVQISDGMCGFKFIRRSILEDLILNGSISDGWFFCSEILVVGEWLNYKIAELPVKWTDDDKSKVNIINLAKEYIQAMRVLKNTRQIG